MHFAKVERQAQKTNGLFHDPEWAFDANKILKTFFKSFGIFLCLKFSQASLEKL